MKKPKREIFSKSFLTDACSQLNPGLGKRREEKIIEIIRE